MFLSFQQNLKPWTEKSKEFTEKKVNQTIKIQFNEKYKKASKNYLDKNIRALKEEQPGVAYKCLKKLGAQPRNCLDENTFTLLNHLEQGLTTEESIDKIADFLQPLAKNLNHLRLRN